MTTYIRREREGEFGLHLYACKKMLVTGTMPGIALST